MLAWTASSMASDGLPAVMHPSKKVPSPPSLPSPPVPRMMAPCFFCGLYPGGRGPSHLVVRVPDCASPALSVKWLPDGPLIIAVTYVNTTEVLLGVSFEFPSYIPFSRSAATHGPFPPPLAHCVLLPQ